jgi:hypothetical protein
MDLELIGLDRALAERLRRWLLLSDLVGALAVVAIAIVLIAHSID